MTSLQENLDWFKTHKVPNKTLFGDLQELAKPKILGSWENQWYQRGHWIKRQDSTGFDGVVERLPKYLGMITELMTVKDLLKELENAFAGKETNE